MRKLVITAIALAIGSSPVLAAPATRGEVQLAQIEPAQYAEGVISAIDRTRYTLTMDGLTYAVAPNDLYLFQPGEQVRIAYLPRGNAREALWVQHTDKDYIERRPFFPFGGTF